MAIDLYWELAALFYEHDTVHLPGIGGFSLRDTPAEVDPVQGKVEAPSRQVVFDPNLVIDDGLLANRLREVHQLSAQEAEQRIAAFITSIKATLDQGELVAFAGIGRLYRNYNGELQFLADGRNFSTETFGLSPVELQAVSRTNRPPAAEGKPNGPAYSGARRTPVVPFSPPWLVWIREHLLYIIGATAVIFLVGMFILSRNTPPDPSLEAPPRIPRERLNVPPSGTTPPATSPDREAEAPIQEDRPEEATPPVDLGTSRDRYAVIAVGLFKDETNVQKMLTRIEGAGLEPFTVREGTLTRVGVQVRYQDEAELITTLRRVQARIEDGAFILEKEGQRLAPQ